MPNENKLFDMLLGMAKPVCDWIGVWDLDEYLTISDPLLWGNVLGFLERHDRGIVRLPWWVLGSEGHETKPPGLLLENYRHGFLQTEHVKTVVRSGIVLSWTFSLYPLEYAKDSALSDPSLYWYYTQIRLQPDEFTSSRLADGTECQLPVSPIFLKHYMSRSFQVGWERDHPRRVGSRRSGLGVRYLCKGSDSGGCCSRALFI